MINVISKLWFEFVRKEAVCYLLGLTPIASADLNESGRDASS